MLLISTSINQLFLILLFLLLFSLLAQGDELKIQSANLQLANVYHAEIDLEDYWVSEKLDGVRAYWNGKYFISKQGNIYQAPQWFIHDFPKFSLDGELWLGRGQFSILSGIVRKQHPIDEEWQKVSYQVFDLPDHQGDFDRRLIQLRQYFDQKNIPSWLQLIPQYKVQNEEELFTRLKQVEIIEGEGLMLHKGPSFYHGGRDDELLKLKTYHDAEAQVLQHLPGKGKYQNALGSLLVKAVNHEQEGRIFKIGSGFSDLERKNPPEIGAYITYKYFGFTSKGLPRFASFMRIRE